MSASCSVVRELGAGRAVGFGATLFSHMCREVERERVGQFGMNRRRYEKRRPETVHPWRDRPATAWVSQGECPLPVSQPGKAGCPPTLSWARCRFPSQVSLVALVGLSRWACVSLGECV